MNAVPEEFLSLMREKLGAEFPEFVASLQSPPPTSIRINPKKENRFVTSLQPVPWSAYGRYLSERPVFTLDPLFHAGTYYVQEPSSMFLEQAVTQSIDPGKPITVLDLAAAPGGKSTHLGSLISGDSLLVSNEVIRSRASILSENIKKWGLANSIVTTNDPKDFGALRGFFDMIVIDAPCSGEGLFRKDPQARAEWSPNNVALCASRQKRILSDVWPALKKDGILIYCTCTYNRSENEDNLTWLSREHSMEFISIRTAPSWNVDEIEEDRIRAYRFFPHRLQGEGFFMAAVRKTENEQPAKWKARALSPAPDRHAAEVKRGLLNAEAMSLLRHNDLIYFLPTGVVDPAAQIAEALRVVHAGTDAVTAKHDKLIPSHSLALSAALNTGHFPQLHVDREDAIRFMRRDPLKVYPAERGYYLLIFENVPLGWINVVGNRYNNLYPMDWRIRMAPTTSSGPVQN